jgi:DNA-binding response OmpR family regulator
MSPVPSGGQGGFFLPPPKAAANLVGGPTARVTGDLMVEKSRKNILILDPERDTAELFTRALESYNEGYKCYWVNSSQQARSLLSEIPFCFLIADASLLQRDGVLLMDSIREAVCGTVLIANAYLNEKHNLRKIMEMGASASFIKPIMVSSLRKLIDDFSVSAAT